MILCDTRRFSIFLPSLFGVTAGIKVMRTGMPSRICYTIDAVNPHKDSDGELNAKLRSQKTAVATKKRWRKDSETDGRRSAIKFHIVIQTVAFLDLFSLLNFICKVRYFLFFYFTSVGASLTKPPQDLC